MATTSDVIAKLSRPS